MVFGTFGDPGHIIHSDIISGGLGGLRATTRESDINITKQIPCTGSVPAPIRPARPQRRQPRAHGQVVVAAPRGLERRRGRWCRQPAA